MKRNNPEKQRCPNLILTADWHLREDQPVCRTDDFWKAQWAKIDFINDLAEHEGCDDHLPIFHAGDLFHHWKPSPHLLNMTLQHLPMYFKTILGQHDLPQHNVDLIYKCGAAVIDIARGQEVFLNGYHYGQNPDDKLRLVKPYITFHNRKILIWHKLVWEKKAPHWSDAPTAKEILDQYPKYDLIITGDNHTSFVVENHGRLLVNPGSLARQTADQENHKPRVYFWYAKTNTVETVFLPIGKDVMTREHIERAKQRDKRIEAFVESLAGNWEIEISFEKNLERFIEENNIHKTVNRIIQKAISPEKEDDKP